MIADPVLGATVVTLSYRRPDLFARLDDSLPPCGGAIVEKVLVNNGGDAETAREADRRGWTILEPGSNLSFSAGCNLGVSESVSSHVLLVSNDAVLSERAVRMLWLHRSQRFVGPLIVDSGGAVNFAGGAIRAPGWMPVHLDRGANPDDLDPRPRFCPWLTGACIMVERALWNQLGGMDEGYLRFGGFQDCDLALRALELGIWPMVVMEARITHDEFGTRRGSDDGANWQRFRDVWLETGRLQRVLGVVS